MENGIQVVEELPKTPSLGLQPGTRAWLLSTQATHHDVITAVAAASHSLPLAAISWRCRASKDFFLQLLAVLRGMRMYDGEIWRFGFFWKDPQCIAEWLAANKALLLQHIGVPFHCDFLQVRSPESRAAFVMHVFHASFLMYNSIFSFEREVEHRCKQAHELQPMWGRPGWSFTASTAPHTASLALRCYLAHRHP
jgi:hypothetical protein